MGIQNDLKRFIGAIVLVTGALACSNAIGQDQGGFFTDPQTGLVYRKVKRIVHQPRYETKLQKQEQTVYKPHRVVDTAPQTQTVYRPVTSLEWQSYLEGRWNPFRQPTIAYRQVAKTRWVPSTQAVGTNTKTNWVAEKRTVEVPQRLVRMEPKETTQFELVGKVAPSRPDPNVANNAIAARLQPLPSTAAVDPIGSRSGVLPNNGFGTNSAVAGIQNSTVPSVPRLASTSVGRMTSDPPRRSVGQAGLRANDLYPTNSGIGQPLPPASNASGIARLPFGFWR